MGRAFLAVDFSVVIPVKDEAGNVAALLAEVRAALAGRAFEVIFVDDGSSDATPQALQACKGRAPELRVVRHSENCGQSSAIRSGVFFARGAKIITLDGDGQNDPADIPALIAKFEAGSNDPKLALVMGQRRKRNEGLAKRWASKIANAVRSRALGDHTRDVGCGLKLFTREAYLRLPYFHGMHRFLPALMIREGYAIDFVDVNDRPRGSGRSKYGVLDRALQAIPDLLGVMWLKRRTRLPNERTEI
jgi:glycosyltransferase involved in cell wall biosynthesis